MKIVVGDRDDQLRCLSDEDILLGLITKQKPPDDRWRIELFMRVDGVASTKEEAIAFAKGCEAMGNAFGLFTRPAPTSPNVIQRGGLQHARTPVKTKG